MKESGCSQWTNPVRPSRQSYKLRRMGQDGGWYLWNQQQRLNKWKVQAGLQTKSHSPQNVHTVKPVTKASHLKDLWLLTAVNAVRSGNPWEMVTARMKLFSRCIYSILGIAKACLKRTKASCSCVENFDSLWPMIFRISNLSLMAWLMDDKSPNGDPSSDLSFGCTYFMLEKADWRWPSTDKELLMIRFSHDWG